jgi:hypothetical protein
MAHVCSASCRCAWEMGRFGGSYRADRRIAIQTATPHRNCVTLDKGVRPSPEPEASERDPTMNAARKDLQQAPQPQSTMPRSPDFPRWRRNGGTRPASSSRCTSSIRCASPTSSEQVSAFRPRRARPPNLQGAALSRHRLRRRAAVRADGAARRRRCRRRCVGDQYRGREASCRANRARHRLPRDHGRGPRRRGRDLRRRAQHGGGRARRRRAALI